MILWIDVHWVYFIFSLPSLSSSSLTNTHIHRFVLEISEKLFSMILEFFVSVCFLRFVTKHAPFLAGIIPPFNV